MNHKKIWPPIFYVAVQMPNTGRGKNRLWYYKASKDVRRMFAIERQLNPLSWKQSFIESLMVVPKRRYHYPFQIQDDVIMAGLSKVVGITEQRPKYLIATTKAQFVLPEIWTAEDESTNHLKYVQHDYNTATKAKITHDWHYWRLSDNRHFALNCYQTINKVY